MSKLSTTTISIPIPQLCNNLIVKSKPQASMGDKEKQYHFRSERARHE
jgi:hypothetical protein